MRHNQQKPLDDLAEPRTSNELVKLIRKLRWMGMEEEAERAQDEFHGFVAGLAQARASLLDQVGNPAVTGTPTCGLDAIATSVIGGGYRRRP
jgi:hypothetical protein